MRFPEPMVRFLELLTLESLLPVCLGVLLCLLSQAVAVHFLLRVLKGLRDATGPEAERQEAGAAIGNWLAIPFRGQSITTEKRRWRNGA